MSKSSLRTALFATLLLCAATFAQAADALLDAIDRAGEQRMLSQRIVKDYCLLGLAIQPLAAKAQLDAAIQRFDANLAVLRSTASAHPDSAAALLALEDSWSRFRSMIDGLPKLTTAERLSREAENVLVAAERLTRALASHATGDAARQIRLAGRQRMLAQRLAKAYLLNSWGTDSVSLQEELESAELEFAGGLALLREHPGNTPELRRELDDLALQWEWLATALRTDGATSYRLIVVEAADAMLAVADRITQLYLTQAQTPNR